MRDLEPGSFQERYATLVIAADTLLGGNVRSISGTDRMIADSWMSDFEIPVVYGDSFSVALRSQGGVELGRSDGVNDYFERNGLHEVASEVMGIADVFDCNRLDYVKNQVNALGLMLKTAHAIATKGKIPSFRERYVAAIGEDPELIDPTETREALDRVLVDLGYGGRGLSERFDMWQRDNAISPEGISNLAHSVREEIIGWTRSDLLEKIGIDAGIYGKHLDGVNLTHQRVSIVSGVSFTGFNLYDGGRLQDGRLLFDGKFEYNSDHPLTYPGLLRLVAHEAVPGHYLECVLRDIGCDSGDFGFEGTMGLMGTSAAVLEEGMAKNTLAFLSGRTGTRDNAPNRVATRFSNPNFGGALSSDLALHLRVELLREDLEDIGKHNSPVLVQEQKWGLDRVKRYLQDECALPRHLVEKLTSPGFAGHLIAGAMYRTAYQKGKELVADALEKHGVLPVVGVGRHLEGLADARIFQNKLGLLD